MKKVIALTKDGEAQSYGDVQDYLDMTVTEDSSEIDKLVALISYSLEFGAKIVDMNKLHGMIQEQQEAMNQPSDFEEHNTQWGLP